MEIRIAGRVEDAVHAGGHQAERRAPLAEVAVDSHDRVVGRRFDGAVLTAGHPVRHRIQHPHRPAGRGTAGELGGADDPGRGWCAGVAVLTGQRRRTSDAARIEEPLAGVAVDHGEAVDPEVEQAGAGHEEWSPLAVEGLECREVEFGWVRLDLAEVGVHCGIEGEVAGHPVAKVAAGADRLTTIPGIRPAHRLVLREDVGRHLSPSRCVETAEAHQGPELRHETGARLVIQRPAGLGGVSLQV